MVTKVIYLLCEFYGKMTKIKQIIMKLPGNEDLINEWELYIDKSDTFIEYFEWLEIELIKSRQKIYPLKCDTVIQQLGMKQGLIICEFEDIYQASKITGIRASAISSNINNPEKIKHAGGFIWRKVKNIKK